jgi:hypothetical protein
VIFNPAMGYNRILADRYRLTIQRDASDIGQCPEQSWQALSGHNRTKPVTHRRLDQLIRWAIAQG